MLECRYFNIFIKSWNDKYTIKISTINSQRYTLRVKKRKFHVFTYRHCGFT